MTKILIFGSNGMLGRYVYLFLTANLKDKFNIVALTRKDFDILNDTFENLNLLIQKFGDNNIVVNCAGIIPQRCNLNNFKDFIKVNSLFPHKLNEYCKLVNNKFIHITTDCVFNGLKGKYTELDLHSETNIYGVSKSLGEPDDACVIRTSIIGHELFNKCSLLEWIISKNKSEINGFVNHYWNGVTCLTLAKIICQIIDKNLYWHGKRHIFSPDTLSKYEICLLVNEIYNLDLKINKFGTDKIDKSLSSIYKNDFEIKSIKDQIIELHSFAI